MDSKILRIIVRGYSMEPLLKNGDIVYSVKSDAYVLGDILIFAKDSNVIIHRFIDVDNENNCIVCKGDNSFEIEEINLSDVIGKAVLFEHDEIKRRILRPSNYFIKTDIMVNKIYKRFNNSIRYTIKSDIYNEYLKERDILFKKHILSLD